MDRNLVMDDEEEQLYLLEVMVNRLTVTKEGILDSMTEADLSVDEGKSKKTPKGPVRVKVKFFDFPTIEIDEEEFKNYEHAGSSVSVSQQKEGPDTFLEDAKRDEERWRAKNAGMSVEMWRDERERDRKLASEVAETLPPGNRFTRGKSCLFPMMPTDMIKTIQKYPLEVQVLRMSTDKGPAHSIGQARVELGHNFKEAVTVATTPVVLPVSAYIEDKYNLHNVFGDSTGDVSLFIRLSCFGATIFTQFKYIQGDKGVTSKLTEMARSKKTLNDRKKREEEKRKAAEEKRPPCISVDDNLPTGGICSRVDDEFSLPVHWRNIDEPELNLKLCYPPDYKRGQHQDISYKCALGNNESVNLSKMFPGISRNYPNYDCAQKVLDSGCPCPCPSSQQSGGRIQCGGFNTADKQDRSKNAPGKTNMTPNLKSRNDTYLTENYEEDECTVNTSKDITDLVDSDWELMVSSQSERAKPKKRLPQHPGKTNYNPVQRSGHPCPVSADGRCRCPKESQQKKPRTTECPERRQPTTQSGGTSRGQYGQGPYSANTYPPINETGALLTGLPRLCDPLMQNINNLIPPNVMLPQNYRGQNVVSICTCPKVPDFMPTADMRGPNDGLNIRCECSNILTSVHPVKVPYTCPGSFPEPKGDMICGPVAPRPINIPPPILEPQVTQMPCPPCPPTCAQSLPTLVLSDESSSDEEYQYVERKKHHKKSTKRRKEADECSAQTPKKSKKKSLSSAYEGSDRPDYDSTAHKMLEEELDFYESMVDEVKNKAKGGGDTKSLRSKKEGLGSAISKEKPKSDEDKKDTLYRYTAGMYPGVHIGHKDCVLPYRFVPKNMGWLWNIKNAAGILKAGRGWRPGAIAESVAELMDAAKNTTYKAKKKQRKAQTSRKKKDDHPGKKTAKMLKEERKDKDDGDKSPEDLRPTLHVHKKHGLYYVSMFPPKKDDEPEPQPIQFKIDPKHPDGPGGDSSLFETEDTSTNSEDSFQLEFVAPHTLKGRSPAKTKHDIQCQVSSDHMIVVPQPPSIIKIKTPKRKKSRSKTKKGKGKKGKGKGKGKKGKGKKSKKVSRK